MIETYSKNVNAATNEPINLNSVALFKGCSVVKQGASSLVFNKCGIYKLTCTASATAQEAGEISIQLQKNGLLVPQTEMSVTAADTTSVHPIGFTTLVQVANNNTDCQCSIPTVIDIVNTGVGAVFDIDVLVTKI